MPRLSKQISGEASPEAMSSPEAPSRDAEGDTVLLSGGARASIQHGAEVIRRAWEHAPEGPGVYRMIAADGEVLYVGKAKNVRKRIASYMRPLSQTSRIARMVALTASMVFVSTGTETEALLLETNFIKQMKPRFNVLMRDDKSFPFILLTGDHPAPQITKHRGARSRQGAYFGPFASVWAVNRTLNALQRAFLLRSCSDSYFANRTRPCLLYQIKRCSAPCTGEICAADYAALVEQARAFLSGKSRAVRESLAQEMAAASDAMRFEQAARLRDRIAALSAIQSAQGINPKTVEEADVFAIAEEAGQFCVEVFFFRTYQNWGNRAYFPRADKSLTPEEVLDSFLAQFYADKPPARLILLSHGIENRAVLEEALRERANGRIQIAVPLKGEKKDLVEQARQNAAESLGRKLSETVSQERLLAALANAFGLGRPPRRIEVYDNSHVMGTNAVGAMIVAGAEGFIKMQYRIFNIKTQDMAPGDDYAMMREVLSRRFAKLSDAEGAVIGAGPAVRASLPSEAGEWPAPPSLEAPAGGEAAEEASFPARPDLILIDGGRGQFEAAQSVLAGMGVGGVAVAAIAKGPDRNAGRESFFVAGREPFRLSPRDPALYFVQRLRDEAHRFAIGAHRARRKRGFAASPLDEIPGIGPARKRALLHAFGTAKAVSRAALADFEKVPGINAATARVIYDFFHDRGRQ
jgi:excinuclease ABC subunit C